MRKVLVIAAIFATVSTANASGPTEPAWSASWSVEVATKVSCAIRKMYFVPDYWKPDNKGLLNGTIFDRAIASFQASTRPHGAIIPAEEVGIIRFGLHFYPDEKNEPEGTRIMQIDLVGHTVRKQEVPHTDMDFFWFSEKATHDIMQKFLTSEPTSGAMYLANGEVRALELPGYVSPNFRVWLEMLRTCIRENSD